MKEKISVPEGLNAAAIEKKYNVSKATAWRAAKRGWLYQNYHGDQSSEPVKKGISQKFERLVKQPAVNIAQLTSISQQKIHDVITGKSTLREKDWIAFKNEWIEIRNLLRKFEKSGNIKHLKTIATDARIKHFVLFENKKMLDRLRKDQNVYRQEISQAKEKTKNFLNRTHL